MKIAQADKILQFWFGPPGNDSQPQKKWFIKNPEFDRQLRNQFGELTELAAAGKLTSWQAEADTCLALILLLDQFPRNLYRGSAQAFATDAQALAVADRAIVERFDRDRSNGQARPAVQRWFFYLPLEHSENMAHQERAVALFEQLRGDPASASTINYAHRHRDVIKRFGRFPHRNAALGRRTTPEEAAFLQQVGSSF